MPSKNQIEQTDIHQTQASKHTARTVSQIRLRDIVKNTLECQRLVSEI
jgi:hypothetical protein